MAEPTIIIDLTEENEEDIETREDPGRCGDKCGNKTFYEDVIGCATPDCDHVLCEDCTWERGDNMMPWFCAKCRSS
jgi:hypothetical protein